MLGERIKTMIRATIGYSLAAILAACGSGSQPKPGDVPAYDGISASETIHLSGTEPFWSITIEGDRLTYATPDNIGGSVTSVTRFAGNGGLGLSGTLEGAALQIAVTPGECSDGMSDRAYPFTATITLGDAMLEGCGYTNAQPYSGEETP